MNPEAAAVLGGVRHRVRAGFAARAGTAVVDEAA